jgi:hypothetical protein
MADAAPSLKEVAAHTDDIDQRLRAVERLIKVFALERYVNLCVSVVSFVLLVVLAIYTFAGSDQTGQQWILTFLFTGAGGGMLWATSQFLKMWTQALHALEGGTP